MRKGELGFIFVKDSNSVGLVKFVGGVRLVWEIVKRGCSGNFVFRV